MAEKPRQRAGAVGSVLGTGLKEVREEADRVALPLGRRPRLGSFVQQSLSRAFEHHVAGFAGNLAFHSLLAVPASLLTLLRLLTALHQQRLAASVTVLATTALPAPASTVIRAQITQGPASQAAGGFTAGLLLSLMVSLWALMQTFHGAMQALNTIYDTQERRPLWRRYLLCLAASVTVGTLLIGALLLVDRGPTLAAALFRRVGLGPLLHIVSALVTLPILGVLVLFAFALVYYFGPDVRQPFRWVRTGSLLAAGLWMLFAELYSLYVNRFTAPTQTYGFLGGVVILMLYLYGSSYILLLGAEMDRVFEGEGEQGNARLNPPQSGPAARDGAAGARARARRQEPGRQEH